LLHESGEVIRSGKLHVPASKQDPQGYGSALTYCRRYSLMTACGISPEDDDGNAASKPKQDVARSIGMTPKGLADLMAKMEEADNLTKLKEEFANAYKLAKVAGDLESMAKLETHYKHLKEQVPA
jgi:hypothetical protein